MATDVLILILGDQLDARLASLRGVDRTTARILMVEVMEEATYVRHHKKKIAFLFAAMRHHAQALRAEGWRVDYVTLDDAGNSGSFSGEIRRWAARLKPSLIRVAEPGEWRVERMIDGWQEATGIPVEVVPDDRFYVSRPDFATWADGRETLVMEDFYRRQRVRAGVLMDGGRPVGGRWNYDRDNRKRAPRGANFPAPPRFPPDPTTRAAIALVADRFADHFGDLEPFQIAVTREEAVVALDHFIDVALPLFGDYQDAMVDGQDHLYHSYLSPYLNAGLLAPREVVAAAVEAHARGEAPLNAVEGFVRQILGWREYVRGLYWLDMPAYAEVNALGATRPLPHFYWTGETDMRCLSQAVDVTRREAYAHHIQRLMLLGNFAMLAGVEPKRISDWFLVVYADAYEWVELPNVIGMSQFADGGRLGTKPYAAGGNYIDRMSDHCPRCRYDPKQRTGPDACPFNPLYWTFLERHRGRLSDNHRVRYAYLTWDRFGEEQQEAIRADAARILDDLEPEAPGWARPI